MCVLVLTHPHIFLPLFSSAFTRLSACFQQLISNVLSLESWRYLCVLSDDPVNCFVCRYVCVCVCVLIQQSVSQTGSVASILLVCMCKAKKGLRHTSMTLRLHYLCDTTTARSVVITEWRCIIATMELQRRITCITQCVCHEGTHAFFLFLQARRWLSVWLPHVPNCDNNPHKLTNCPGELHGRAALPTSGGHENNMHKFKYI